MASIFRDQFENELVKMLDAERATKLAELEFGGGVEDYASYRERVGYLQALKAIQEMFDAIHTKINNAR